MQYVLCETLDEVLAIPKGTIVTVEVYEPEIRRDEPTFVGEEALEFGMTSSDGKPDYITTDHARSYYMPEEWQDNLHEFVGDGHSLRIFRPVAE